MSEWPAGEQRLLSILAKLRPYESDVVLIGGWVPYLYRRYGGFPEWRGPLSLTEEADVLVSPPLERGERPTLATVLRNAGFTPVDDRSPAVWVNEETDERIEFLATHRGTAKQIGAVASVPGQLGIGAISLPGLELLARHSAALAIPGKTANAGEIIVRLPTLGAYILNKATTFMQRSASISEPNPKAGKDVVYLRDVMAGGAAVRERVALDVSRIARKEKTGRLAVGAARSAVADLLAGRQPAAFAAAARLVLERDAPGSIEVAAADLRGHLDLLVELLESISK